MNKKQQRLVEVARGQLAKGETPDHVYKSTLLKGGLPEKDADRAIKELYNEKQARDYKKTAAESLNHGKPDSSQPQPKGSFWLYLFVAVFIMALLYLIFSGGIFIG
ncbi:hypothetical protein HYS31_06015 [Candidatus Woesearchaeota archaeon]|nr:hypothetical protein [Candidatus Woesearchaeota archaeon]